MRSEEQINASKENGAKSHGPTSESGRARVSQNARTHGLTSQLIIVAEEDKPVYDELLAIVFNHYDPKSSMEKEVVQAIADLEWKLKKADVYEAGIYLKGRHENQQFFREDDESAVPNRFILVEGDIQVCYSKQLTNLSLQYSRAQRNLEKRIKQFEAMRAEREIVEVAQRNIAMDSMRGDPNDTSPPHPSVGTVFSKFYLIERIKFEQSAGRENLAVFDRTWRHKSAPNRDFGPSKA